MNANMGRQEMNKMNCGLLRIAFLVLAMVFLAGCTSNDDGNDPEPLTSAFELTYATYWGGSPQANKGNAICVDKDGYIYLAGETQCPSFPLKNAVIDETFSTTGFVSKFAADGQAVLYSTFLGDPHGYNFCEAMDVDGQGNAIAGGLAGGQNFPLKDPLFGTFTEPWSCAFLSSIHPQGGALNFSTFIPYSIPYGRIAALALDAEGNIYLAARYGGTILKISMNGQRLLNQYSIPGFSNLSAIEDIAVAPDGSLVVAGWTDAADDFLNDDPVCLGSGGLEDAFVLMLDPEGIALKFSTQLGGSEDDFANGVAVGSDGSIYVCGSTSSADFPLKNAADALYGGGSDGFAAKIDPVSGTLLYSTYLGGGGEDEATAMAVNAANQAYLAGWTTSSDFPVRGAFQERLGGVKDPFVTKLNMNGDQILLSTYCGGSSRPAYGSSETGADWANDICLGPEGRICITGETQASDFPLKNPLDSANSFSKAFIAVLREKQL
jgi:hypothetical protein